MGRMSLETRAKVIAIRSRNYSLMKIKEHLEEGVSVSKMAIYLLIKKREHQTKAYTLDSTGKSLLLYQQSNGREQWSHTQTAALGSGLWISEGIAISTLERARLRLGWISKKTRYCALITEQNQEKRLDFCKALIDTNDLEFSDVIWTDECSVQLEFHCKITYHCRLTYVVIQNILTRLGWHLETWSHINRYL